jgi:hypothetical protein
VAGAAIFGPFFGMLLLTFVVWVYLYVRRLAFIKANRIDAQQLTTPVRGEQIIPEKVSYPSYNFRNLFELPVVFYVLCLFLYVTQVVDEVYVIAAWGFFGLRVLHSLIHCTINIVMLRFIAYMAGALTLWFMVARAAIGYFQL